MQNDIIAQVLKETAIEIKNEIKDIPAIAIPAALFGLLNVPVLTVISLIVMFGVYAYGNYQDLISSPVETEEDKDND